MRTLRPLLGFLLHTLLLFTPALAGAETPADDGTLAKDTAARKIEFFEARIRPVLTEVCLKCHGGDKTARALRVDGREHLLHGGETGPAIVPGDPEGSLLLRAIGGGDADLQMPPKKRLPERVVRDFERWIADGAVWPTPPTNAAEAKKRAAAGRHWAFRPPTQPRLDRLAGGAEDHPVDRFIRSRQRAAGTHPNPSADRRTLLRRAAFDLTGLPPSPADVKSFLGDSLPGAFERAVDRLLASPRYGERWGRHWLDLVRYADTAGDDSDYPIPQASLYRDYVIDAFNADKPYDEFLHEQIAGDLLAKSSPPQRFRELNIATGFLAQAKRFATRKHEDMHLVIEDTIHTIGQVTMGMTLRCARCHDHKYDPVTTKDYYALYGFFKSTVYPHAGSEEHRKPSDLVPLVAEAVLSEREEAFRAQHAERIERLEESIQEFEAREKDKKKRAAASAKPRAELERILADSPRRTVPVSYSVKEGTPGDVEVQVGGNPREKGELVRRGVPRVLANGDEFQIAEGQSGRLELARWLTRASHPLTARVMVNRIWQHHFGKGIVSTPSNFGLQGEEPTHPALLDWLAWRFVESGWSIKDMHRLILSSKTWQRTCSSNTENELLDPANTTYWRFDRRRLAAEEIRDTLLLAGGNLNLSRPGPHPFPPVNKWRYSAHHQFKAVYPSNHRSVYLMVQRLHPHPFLALFNGPDTTASTAVRDASSLPLQTLFLTNSSFIHEQATGLARDVLATESDIVARLEILHERCFARPPTDEERQRALAYLSEYSRELVPSSSPDKDLAPEAWSSLARVLFAANEFAYVD